MSFEDKPTEELIKLAKSGLGFSINPDAKPPEDIQKIINAAFEGGATISFINPGSIERLD
jgi:hypothetical protein